MQQPLLADTTYVRGMTEYCPKFVNIVLFFKTTILLRQDCLKIHNYKSSGHSDRLVPMFEFVEISI